MFLPLGFEAVTEIYSAYLLRDGHIFVARLFLLSCLQKQITIHKTFPWTDELIVVF